MQPEGIIKVGRLRGRCRDEGRKEARRLGISWWAAAINREEWRELLQKAKTRKSCSAYDDDDDDDGDDDDDDVDDD
jgi:hypothetical protein